MTKFYKILNHPELSDYLISEDGRIFSKKSNKLMSTHLINGYVVFVNGNNTYAINRLIGETFNPNKNSDDLMADHIDGNPLNNNKNNIQWITQKENIAKRMVDTSHPRKVIRKDLNGIIIDEFASVTEASEVIGVSRSAISKACLKINQSCGGFIFDYVDNEHEHKNINIDEGKMIDNYDNYIVFKDGKIYNKIRKSYVKPIINKAGHAYITLCKNKTKQNFYIHRLVAESYIDNPNNKQYVKHKNGNKSDNRVENLEWY